MLLSSVYFIDTGMKEPLGPRVFIWGEAVLRRYLTDYTQINSANNYNTAATAATNNSNSSSSSSSSSSSNNDNNTIYKQGISRSTTGRASRSASPSAGRRTSPREHITNTWHSPKRPSFCVKLGYYCLKHGKIVPRRVLHYANIF